MRVLLMMLSFQFFGLLVAQDIEKPLVLDISDIHNNTKEAFQNIYQSARKARVVFNGENHLMVEFNARMEYTMMRSLYENCGYRNFIIEMSPSRAYYMERYVSHNDTQARNYLRSVSSLKFLTLFDHLHQWMQTIPKQDRIKIHGIDVERFNDMSIYLLNDVIGKQKTVPPIPIYTLSRVILPNIASFLYKEGSLNYFYSDVDYGSVKNFNSDDLKINSFSTSEVHGLVDTISSNLNYFKQWLNDTDYSVFYKAYNGLLENSQWEKSEGTAQQYLWREEIMYRNFLEILKQDTSQKFFGQFGRCHSALVKQAGDCGWYNYRSVCSKVRNRYFGGDSSKILSIAIMYRNQDEHLNASETKNNDKMMEEIESLKSQKSDLPLLFDLSKSLEFTELKKKFNFVILHSDKIKELEVLDSEVIRNGQSVEAAPYVFEHPRNLHYNFFGLGYGVMNMDLTNQFMQSKGVGLSNLPRLFLNHHIAYESSRFLTQANIFYGWSEVFADTAKKINYNMMGATLGLGMNIFKTSNLLIELMAIGGGIYQKIENYPESLDILRVNENIVNIESNMFVFGGQMQVKYKFSRYVAIGVRYQMLYTPHDLRWNYKNSNILYQNLGKTKNMVFNDLGCYLNFIFPIRH